MKYTLKNYPAYLKDNPKGYWFKRKLYGWGWVPVKLEGWIVTLVFIIFLIFLGTNRVTNPDSNPTYFFTGLILAIFALIWICYKTGEKPKWTWGRN